MCAVRKNTLDVFMMLVRLFEEIIVVENRCFYWLVEKDFITVVLWELDSVEWTSLRFLIQDM